jgi:hypothetical protein
MRARVNAATAKALQLLEKPAVLLTGSAGSGV